MTKYPLDHSEGVHMFKQLLQLFRRGGQEATQPQKPVHTAPGYAAAVALEKAHLDYFAALDKAHLASEEQTAREIAAAYIEAGNYHAAMYYRPARFAADEITRQQYGMEFVQDVALQQFGANSPQYRAALKPVSYTLGG